MGDIRFLKRKKQFRVLTWCSYFLLFFGVANCVSSQYLTPLEQAPVWPVVCVLIAVASLLVIQQKLERDDQY